MPGLQGYNASMYNAAENLPAPDFNQIDARSAYFPQNSEIPITDNQVSTSSASPITDKPMSQRGMMGKPASWWLMLVVVFAIFVFVSRKFDGPEKFGNIKLTLWNGVFATLFVVIMLNFLKVVFSYFKVPGLSDLVAAA